jgi:hypothetical protein
MMDRLKHLRDNADLFDFLAAETLALSQAIEILERLGRMLPERDKEEATNAD